MGFGPILFCIINSGPTRVVRYCSIHIRRTIAVIPARQYVYVCTGYYRSMGFAENLIHAMKRRSFAALLTAGTLPYFVSSFC